MNSEYEAGGGGLAAASGRDGDGIAGLAGRRVIARVALAIPHDLIDSGNAGQGPQVFPNHAALIRNNDAHRGRLGEGERNSGRGFELVNKGIGVGGSARDG